MAEQKHDIWQSIDLLPKAGITSFTVCYAIGFIIVNLYLLGFGITELNLIKTKYISAGILYLFLLGPSVFFALWFIIHKVNFLKFSITAVILSIFLCITVRHSPRPIAVIPIFSMFNSIAFYFLLKAYSDIPKGPTSIAAPERYLLYIARAFIAIVLLLVSIELFAVLIYPFLSPFYGGGELLQVQVMFKDGKFQKSLGRVLSSLPLETYLVTQDTETITLYMALDKEGEIFDATVSFPRSRVESINLGVGFLRTSPRLIPNKNIYQIAQIFANVLDNSEPSKHKELLKTKLKTIKLNDKEIDFFINLFHKVSIEIRSAI